MNKTVTIISSTLRKKGNSDRLAEAFALGAREAGHRVNKIDVKDLNLQFCIGCLHCQTHEGCVLQDGVNAILDTVQNSDVLVFATPIYYYEMSGQLKTFLDRMNPLYPRSNRFKKVYLLTAAAENDESAMDGAIQGVQRWIDCFEGVSLAGVVRGIGVTDVGEIETTEALRQARELGKSIGA